MSIIRNTTLIAIVFIGHLSYSQTVAINDTFDDNRNVWWTGESGGSSTYITNGKMSINTSEGGWLISIYPYVEIEKDFKFETDIKQIDGPDNEGVGIFWGRNKISEEQNYFLISANGYYYIANTKSENTTKIIGVNEWVKTDIPKAIGQSNTLKIEQVGKIMTFYINNQQVASISSFHWQGEGIGLITYTKMKFEVDNFKFDQNITINLPANLTKGFIKENLGPNINTSAADLIPIISADGKQLYFGREQYEGNLGGKTDGEDFYLSVSDGTGWGAAKNMGSPVNSTGVDNILSVSSDNNKIIFVTATKFWSRSRSNDGWNEAQELGLEYTNEGSHFEGFLSSDGKAILMAAKNSENLFYDNTVDESDIYVSTQDQNGKWNAPLNLGPNINSRASEYSPFLAADGRTLYFSSLGRPGYGNADIYMSKRIGNGWTKWTEPVNVGPEINSAFFDAYYVLPASGDIAYMVNNDGGSQGADIISIKMAKELKPNPVVLVKGKTLDAKTQQPIATTILVDNLTTRIEVGEAISDPKTGNYQIVLPYGVNYGFHAGAKGYLSVNENLELITISKYVEMEKNLYLIPIAEGQTLQLNNVFFEQGKAILKPESYPELDRLTVIMKENPTMEIELGGYTDNVGNPISLKALSMDRAGTVKKYMVETGRIPSKRIAGIGYGSSNPIVKNDTEEHRRMNRRVEFKITKK